jgi:hypothetical protein
MSSPESDTDEFEYSGSLVFNGVYRTEIIEDATGDSASEEELLEQLEQNLQPKFERGRPGNPSKGYRSLDLTEYAVERDEIDEELVELARGTIDQQYILEQYEGNAEVVDSDGNPVDAQAGEFVRTPYETYMFWNIPDYMFLKGSVRTVKKTAPEINGALRGTVRQEALSFEYDFLLWLLYNYYNDDNGFGQNLHIHRLTAAKAEGSRDTFGAANQVDESLNLVRSTSFIEAVLQRKMPTMIEGVFNVRGYNLRAKIYSGPEDDVKNRGGKVWILAQEDIENVSDLSRALVALRFLTEVADLYTHWESLDKTDRYVPPTFFTKLRDIGRDEGVDIQFALDDLIEEYLDKRDEDWDDYDF